MNTFFEWLLSLTVAGSAVVACILLLGFISSDTLPSTKWRYRLSKMAAVFYLIPFALSLHWLLPFWETNTTTTAKNTVRGSLSGFNPELSVQEPTLSASIALPLIVLWAIGAITFAAWQVYCYRRFLEKLEGTRMAVPSPSKASEQLSIIKKDLRVKSNVQLAYSTAVRSPVLVGLWKPTIYLPMENTADVDMGMVIRHEIIHLKRKDLWVKAFVLGASSLHWFNPLVHLLRKDIHTWSELSCDEEVVAAMSYAERKRYGETILNVMAGSQRIPVQFCAPLSGDGKQLKRRLTMMLNVKKMKRGALYATLTAVVAVAAIGTGAAAWAASNTPKITEGVNNGALVAEVLPKEAELVPLTDNQMNTEPQPLLIEVPSEQGSEEPLVAEPTELVPVPDRK